MEETNIPVAELPPLPVTNHSPVSNFLGSTTVRGKELLEDPDAIENGIFQDLLEDSAPNVCVTVCGPSPQQGGSEPAIENGISQDFLEDSMPNDGGIACHPCVQQGGPETATVHSTHCSKKRMSFVNKCIRATKTCFMLSHEGDLFDEIDSDAYLNGKVLSAPRKGVQVYKLFWDTSPLHDLVIDESKLRCTVAREDKEMVSGLKGLVCYLMRHIQMDIHQELLWLTIRELGRNNISPNFKNQDKTLNNQLLRSRVRLLMSRQTHRNLTNLRMAPVLGNIFHDASNIPHNNTQYEEENESYDSDEERYG